MDTIKNNTYRFDPEYGNGIYRLFHKNSDNTELYHFGFIKNSEYTSEKSVDYNTAVFNENSCKLSVGTNDNSLLTIQILTNNVLQLEKTQDEEFYGFGFQRIVLDANGSILEFKKEYRWNEATVPFFISSAGYGIFSANPNDQIFDFSKKNYYSINLLNGFHDIYIINGPSYKSIINKYTSITGRPIMIPKWAFGLCYAARVFENQEGLLRIASRFRSEGIPCDMIGVEPGWEEHYYQMEWEWSKTMFPAPKKMIDELHALGYAFELWDSGDAPQNGFTHETNRRNWFSKRIKNSLDIGVDFFKQDDPYPRCITSEEMVTEPEVNNQISENECINIANTLYTETIFNEFKQITGKRTMIIFHSYASSFSSHRYPAVWAGDFKLGNGAINASLSGHSMVTQDMRSEVPDGIHFGFFMPFVFMDSWAYYLEPWLFSNHIKDMICFYSRLRSSLFPYLYTTFRDSHTTGIPMLRPLLLEFQNDATACSIDNQFMLGDAFMVCAVSERGDKVYLPAGNWINYWTGIEYGSTGIYISANWPVYAGGALYVKKGSIIPKSPAYDSLSQFNNDIYILEVFPDGESEVDIYEDDGISYDYEIKNFAHTPVLVNGTEKTIDISVKKTIGSYSNMPKSKQYIIKVYSQNKPCSVKIGEKKVNDTSDKNNMLCSLSSAWVYNEREKYIYIKPQSGWCFESPPEDDYSFYNCKVYVESGADSDINIHINNANIVHTPEQKNFTSPKYSEPLYFNAKINPPYRVKLNHGDNWLPYYIYAAFEITDASGNIVPCSKSVTMEIITSENKIMNYTTKSYMGTGHFKRINLADPGTAVTASIRLSGDGIETYEFNYAPVQDSQSIV